MRVEFAHNGTIKILTLQREVVSKSVIPKTPRVIFTTKVKRCEFYEFVSRLLKNAQNNTIEPFYFMVHYGTKIRIASNRCDVLVEIDRNYYIVKVHRFRIFKKLGWIDRKVDRMKGINILKNKNKKKMDSSKEVNLHEKSGDILQFSNKVPLRTFLFENYVHFGFLAAVGTFVKRVGFFESITLWRSARIATITPKNSPRDECK